MHACTVRNRLVSGLLTVHSRGYLSVRLQAGTMTGTCMSTRQVDIPALEHRKILDPPSVVAAAAAGLLRAPGLPAQISCGYWRAQTARHHDVMNVLGACHNTVQGGGSWAWSGPCSNEVSSGRCGISCAHIQGEMLKAQAALPQPGDHAAVLWFQFQCRPHAGVCRDPMPSAAHPCHRPCSADSP